VTVDVSLHPNVKTAIINAFETEIASATGVPVSHVDIEHGKVRVTVSKDRLAALARIDEVRNIHEYHEPTFFNKAAGEIMEVHQPVGLKNATYKGKGQTVCVSDTGFDTGDKDECHAAFGNRVLALYPLGRQDTGQADDFDGHGTHVCGSVLGNGTYKYKSGGKSEVIESPASQANLIVQALSRDWMVKGKGKTKDPRTWRLDSQGILKSLIELFDSVH
jgi:serine protease AprX